MCKITLHIFLSLEGTFGKKFRLVLNIDSYSERLWVLNGRFSFVIDFFHILNDLIGVFQHLDDVAQKNEEKVPVLVDRTSTL